MTNVCREMGKRLEDRLFQRWGGKPSTQLLRHRDHTIEAVTKLRYHSFLAGKINTQFPDANQEKANPNCADEVYQSGIRWLLSHTRPDDTKRFDLLFKENVGYGFRRNALGVKSLGLIVSFTSIVWTLVKEHVIVSPENRYINFNALAQLSDPAIACVIVAVVMIAIWFFFITKSTVRTAAFAYAEMLLRTCEVL